MTGRAAADIRDGWIYLPTPAEPAGWHRITDAKNDGGWTVFHLADRPAPYTTGNNTELQWSPHRPAQGES